MLELTTKLAEIDGKYSKVNPKREQEKTKLIVEYNKERKNKMECKNE